MASNSCVNTADKFCYICAVKVKYFEHFGFAIRSQDKSWAPHNICSKCYIYLYQPKDTFKWSVPMIWMEPHNHTDDCYFCMTVTTGFNSKNKKLIKYPNLTTTRRPIIYTGADEQDEPEPEDQMEYQPAESFPDSRTPPESVSSGEEFLGHGSQFTQPELDNLVRDLYLSKEAAEILSSRLKDKGLLSPGTSFMYRFRGKEFTQFFKNDGQLVAM